jgi:hypothetical protein
MFLTKGHLASPNKFKELEGLRDFLFKLKTDYKLPFGEEDLSMLLLSVLRCDDISGSYGILKKKGKRRYIDEFKSKSVVRGKSYTQHGSITDGRS